MLSHKNKFIFVHMPKCAGTSITKGLKDCELVNARFHDRLSNLIVMSGENDYFTFTCVRNVYDQLISMVFSRKGEWSRRYFISMVRRIANNPMKNGANWSMSRIKEYIDRPISFVIRFENLEEDWKILLIKLKLPYRDLPHEKANPNKDHYSKYYDQTLIDLVSKTFANEIAMFGWKFEQQ